MEQVRDRVVTLDRGAARGVDLHGDVLADRRSLVALDEMEPRVAGLLRVRHAPELAAAAGQLAVSPIWPPISA